MTNVITGIIGIVAVSVFLGIMLLWVPAPPLMIIVAVVACLLLRDFLQSLRAGNNGGQR
jgi:hypothetical protein